MPVRLAEGRVAGQCVPRQAMSAAARSGFHGYFRALARLPEVSLLAPAMFLQMSLPGPGASPFSGLVAQASPFGGEGVTVDRVKVVAGRIFNPADPGAVMINQQLADREHLRPGGTLHLIGYPQRGPGPDIAHGVRLAFRVSAIVVFDDQIVSAASDRPPPWLLLSQAFARTRQAASFNPAGGGASVLLRPGAGAAAFARGAIALAARYRVGKADVITRATEPSPGIEVNLAILGAGFAVIAVAPLLVVAPAAVRAAARAQGALGLAEPAAPARRSRLGPALGLAGSVPGSLGVRMAFEPGHGRTAVPVRSALAGTTVAVAAVVAAMVFGASFLKLVSTPHRYGQNWAHELDLRVGSVPLTLGSKVLAGITGLTGYAGGHYGHVSLAAPGTGSGMTVPAIGLDQLRGNGFLTLLAGRAPAGPGEIALGQRTLHALGLHLGQ